MNGQLRLGQVTQGEYRDKVWLCSDGRRKAKVKMKLILPRDAKNDRKGFYGYANQNRKAKEGVHPLINSDGKLAAKDKEKVEVLSYNFVSFFNDNVSFHTSQEDGEQDGDWGSKVPLKART